jgi:predicted membrane protein DUF2142
LSWRTTAYPDRVTRLRIVWLLALAAFFFVGSAWAVALPVNGTYDEASHIVRAYAVVSGQWLPVGRAHDDVGLGTQAFRVPVSLLPANPSCMRTPSNQPASCLQSAGGSGTHLVASGAARYSPVYYLPVGLAVLASPNRTGVVAARLISALLSALLLASAVTTAVRARNRLLIAAIVLVCTPTTMNLAGAVNPNGLEISAGVLLFATLLALVYTPTDQRRLLIMAGLAIALLLTVRQLGPVLLLIDIVAVAALAGANRTRELLRRRDARLILGGFTAAGLAVALGWTIAAQSTELEATPQRAQTLSNGALLGQLLTFRIPFYVKQLIGQFGYGETTISPVAVAAWYGLIAVLVLPALWRGGSRLRLVSVGLVIVCTAMLLGLEVYFVRSSGWFSHGRYVLPVLVGVVLAAAFVPLRRHAALASGLVAATLPIDLYALARVMTRFQSGIDAGLNPFTGSWRPPVGPVLPFLAITAGVALLVVLAARAVAATLSDNLATGDRRSTAVAPGH